MFAGPHGQGLPGIHRCAGRAAPALLRAEGDQGRRLVAAPATDPWMGQQPHAVEQPMFRIGENADGVAGVGLQGASAGAEQSVEPIVLHALPGHPVKEIRQASHDQAGLKVPQAERAEAQLAAGDAFQLGLFLPEEADPHHAEGLEGRHPLGRGLLDSPGHARQALTML